MKRLSLAFLLSVTISLSLSGTHTAAAIYKWVDEKGVTHYTDDPRKLPKDHDTLEDLAPVHTMQAPDKALTRVHKAAEKERRQRHQVRQVRKRTSSADARCSTYKRQLDKVQAQLRRGYREPRGNKLRERRRELSARIKQACY